MYSFALSNIHHPPSGVAIPVTNYQADLTRSHLTVPISLSLSLSSGLTKSTSLELHQSTKHNPPLSFIES